MADFNKPLYEVIDISHWNGNINWCDVVDRGIKGVIIKAGGSESGNPKEDKLFEDYYIQAKRHSLLVGAYFFGVGYTYTKGSSDALGFREILKGKQFELPVFIDYERPNTADNKEENTRYVEGFCHTMAQFDFWVGIYGSDISTFKTLLFKDRLLDWSWWVAKYSTKEPTYAKENCQIWQYSSKYDLNGHNTDINKVYIDYEKYIKQRGLNGF